MGKNFYITTAIDYMNGVPHIGHAYEKCQADTFARFRRLFGQEVYFLTGSDEHGQKVAEAAKEAGVSCLEQVNSVLKNFQKLLLDLDISNDDFIRTTEERHWRVVRSILTTLYEKEEIYPGSFEGLYCVADERFWTEKDLEAGNCPLCGREVQQVQEKNYFFKMGKHRDWLIQYIEANPEFIQPNNRRNEILGKLKSEPLKDLCISRPKERLSWGIPLPFNEDYVTYVWFDALLNYVSALDPYEENKPGLLKKFWPETHHIIGKDIAHTHCIYWPIMLKACGYSMPKAVVVHGFVLDKSSHKMSKSLGNTVDPFKMIAEYGGDILRYYLVSGMRKGLDFNFSIEELQTRYNAELADDYGNLLQRSLTMIHKYRQGKIRQPENFSAAAEKMLTFLREKKERVEKEVREFNLPDAVNEAFEIIRRMNKFIVEAQPWQMAKEDIDNPELDEVLCLVFAGIRLSTLLLSPLFPQKAPQIFKQLQLKPEDSSLNPLDFPSVHEVGKPQVIFPKIVTEVAKKKKTSKAEQQVGLVAIEEFKKIKMKTGIILEVEDVKDSENLYLLRVNTGKKEIQLVAGVRKYYSKEELINKNVVVVTNLKPAIIMGYQSEGMLLAATKKGKMSLVTIDSDLPAGSKIS
ncbi:methionine--tRNA ligase [Candidatus Riflebacteria bacterium]